MICLTLALLEFSVPRLSYEPPATERAGIRFVIDDASAFRAGHKAVERRDDPLVHSAHLVVANAGRQLGDRERLGRL